MKYKEVTKVNQDVYDAVWFAWLTGNVVNKLALKEAAVLLYLGTLNQDLVVEEYIARLKGIIKGK